MVRPINPWKLTGYKAGQSVVCKVMAQEPGGYTVVLTKDNLPGFLPTQERLSLGQEVLAQFVCLHSNRILLSSRFAGGAGPGMTRTLETSSSSASESESAFSLWAKNSPGNYKLKRATDLLMPPMDGSIANTIYMKDYDLEWLITDLEGGMRTGCVKASSEERLSRSAMLLYRGRVAGCIYGAKQLSDNLSVEMSLGMMLSDLALPETQASIYDLPENIILPMSALFLGYPVTRSDDLDARSYVDYLFNWFAQKQQTACLALSLPSRSATCLILVHEGEFIGSFYVESQTFTREKDFVYQLLQEEQNAGIESSILPSEMLSSTVRFGFSLSMASKKP